MTKSNTNEGAPLDGTRDILDASSDSRQNYGAVPEPSLDSIHPSIAVTDPGGSSKGNCDF